MITGHNVHGITRKQQFKRIDELYKYNLQTTLTACVQNKKYKTYDICHVYCQNNLQNEFNEYAGKHKTGQ